VLVPHALGDERLEVRLPFEKDAPEPAPPLEHPVDEPVSRGTVHADIQPFAAERDAGDIQRQEMGSEHDDALSRSDRIVIMVPLAKLHQLSEARCRRPPAEPVADDRYAEGTEVPPHEAPLSFLPELRETEPDIDHGGLLDLRREQVKEEAEHAAQHPEHRQGQEGQKPHEPEPQPGRPVCGMIEWKVLESHR